MGSSKRWVLVLKVNQRATFPPLTKARNDVNGPYGRTHEIQAVCTCVVSKARAKRGKVFRMRALAVHRRG